MIKYKSEDFTLIECSYSNNEELSKDEPSLFWEFYKEQDSCILFQAKEVGEIGNKKVIKRDGTLVNISKEDIEKGKILKLFCKNFLNEIKGSNKIFTNDDKEDEWRIENSNKNIDCIVHFIRTNYEGELYHDGNVFLRILLKDESIQDFLGSIYSYLSQEEIEKCFNTIITIDKDWGKTLDKIYKELFNNL